MAIDQAPLRRPLPPPAPNEPMGTRVAVLRRGGIGGARWTRWRTRLTAALPSARPRLGATHAAPLPEGGAAPARAGQLRLRRARGHRRDDRRDGQPEPVHRRRRRPAGLRRAQPARHRRADRLHLRLLQHPRDRAAGRRAGARRPRSAAGSPPSSARCGSREEIDALEVMALRSVPYLVTTRVIAGFVAVIPLYVIGLLTSYLGSRFVTVNVYGQSAGTYDHYFWLFLPPVDIVLSFLKVLALLGHRHPDPLLLRLHGQGGPAGRRPRRRTRGPADDRRDQPVRLLPLPRALGRHDNRADRRMSDRP